MLNKPKILLFTDWYEPGYKAGGPIQSCKNLVELLSDKYDFDIFTSDRDLGDTGPYHEVKTDSWSQSSKGPRIWYASPGKASLSVIKLLIKRVKPDIVYLNSMFSLRFTIIPLLALKLSNYNGRIVLAPRGMLRKGAVSQKRLKKKVFLYILSTIRMLSRVRFHATDEQEKKDIKKYFGTETDIEVIQNVAAIDSAKWQPRDKNKFELKCIFVARIHPIKNLHFAINALSKIDSHCIVEFDVFGSEDDINYSSFCKGLAARTGSHIQINFKGIVEREQLFEVLRRYHLFFLPTIGENFGHAIVEALSAGCPVLISDQTPWTELALAKAGWSLPLESPNEFTTKIEEICAMDESEFNKYSQSAYNYIRLYYSKLDYRSKYDQLFS